jgi:pimeloyl-ACP methyl ester carboxylesterase
VKNLGYVGNHSLYVQDYGAPVGYRLAVKHPERAQALIVQNGNAYEEGMRGDFWSPLKAYWLLGAGHFALEEDGDLIAGYIEDFLAKHVRGA